MVDEVCFEFEVIRVCVVVGEDFGMIVQQVFEDEGLKIVGGDFGFFGCGCMIQFFEVVVFGGIQGEIVGLIENQFGVCIGFYLIEIIVCCDGGVQFYEEVFNWIFVCMFNECVCIEVENCVQVLLIFVVGLLFVGEEVLCMFVEEEGVVFEIFEFFVLIDNLFGLGWLMQFVMVFFEVEIGVLIELIEFVSGWVFGQVFEVQELCILLFDEVCVDVCSVFVGECQNDFVEECFVVVQLCFSVEELIFDEVVEEFGFEICESSEFGVFELFVVVFGVDDFVDVVLVFDVGDIGGLLCSGIGVVFFEVIECQCFDLIVFVVNKEMMSDQECVSCVNMVFGFWI